MNPGASVSLALTTALLAVNTPDQEDGMPDFRLDKFAVGDTVTWAEESYATITDGRARIGDGPFVITKVLDREFEPGDDWNDQSNWSSMGHTQHVYVEGSDSMWSGAFFQAARAISSSPVSEE